MNKLLAIVMLAAFVGSCASSPESIQAAAVDSSPFARFRCPELGSEARRLAGEYSIRARQQDQARTGDIVGVVLVGLPLSSMTGGDQAAEIAKIKGQQEVVRREMIAKRCPVA